MRSGVYLCVTGYCLVECVQIIRWRSSNLRQRPLRNLGSGTILDTLFYPVRPTLLIHLCIVLGFLLRTTPPSPTPPSVDICCQHTLLSQPLTTSSPGAVHRLPGRRPHPPPDSIRRSSLRHGKCYIFIKMNHSASANIDPIIDFY